MKQSVSRHPHAIKSDNVTFGAPAKKKGGWLPIRP